MQDGGQGSSGPGGSGSGFGGGFGGGGLGGGPGGRGKFFDDLAGMAGGAFSVLSGLRAEIESAVQAQVEALTARLNLVKREELDAALEVARRAREQAEELAVRVAALEARMNTAPADATPFETGAGTDPTEAGGGI
ncbi:accessory factor UbiK family protein [Roseomonas nepalensis]|uniref:Accessory factor UbiK family protein n=1 Tax=Muricoccus nepalensis TaxID=1854500 RepID=A0A502G6G7_9PROT|nr:accessory factor UbiK family protein [Roseomonas nepalensis]TPG57202.1 accessory factor UbiK family protein [Roseomonas nepalensis]